MIVFIGHDMNSFRNKETKKDVKNKTRVNQQRDEKQEQICCRSVCVKLT